MEGSNNIPEKEGDLKLYELKIPKRGSFKLYIIIHILMILGIIFISHRIASLDNRILFDKSTLNFYFSSVFQGFAAILGILIVGMVFYVDKLDNKHSNIMQGIVNSLLMAGLYNEYVSYTEKNSKSLTDLVKFLSNKLNSEPPPNNKRNIEKIVEHAIDFWSLNLRGKYRINLMFVNFISIIVVIILSGIALLQTSWLLIVSSYWNVFSVNFITLYFIFVILGLGITLYKILYKDINNV